MPVAANTLALWNLNNVLTDSSGNGYTLGQVGTVPFVTSPAPTEGTHAAGAYGGSQYFFQNSVRTALSGSTTYTVEFYIYITSDSTQKMIITAGAAPGSDEILLDVLTTGAIRIIFDETDVFDSAAGTIALNQWHYVAWVIDGTSVKVYEGLPGVTPDLVINQTSSRTSFPTGGTFAIGALSWLSTFLPAVSTYLDAIRVSNIARTSLPTVDTTPGGSILQRRRRR